MVKITHTHRYQEKIMVRIPHGDKTILVLSFASSVQRNQFGAIKKFKLLHGNVKTTISGVSSSFRTHLQGDLNLYASEKILSYSSKYGAKKI